MDEKTEKAAYAASLLQIGNVPNAAFQAAQIVHKDNLSRALWIAHHWARDPEVLAQVEAGKALRVPFEGQPAVDEVASEVLDGMRACLKRGDADGAAKLSKEYREYRMPKEKAGTVVNVNTNRVMVVKDFGTDEEWEAAAAKQQHDLTHGKHVVH